VIPREPLLAEGAEGPVAPLYEEWEFCEKAWYLEGSQGFFGVLRALFWPTESAVRDRKSPLAPWELYPPPETCRWTYILSEKGFRAMEAYLESEKGDAFVEYPGWYRGQRSYHLFFHCHHFTASALRAAGLPIRPWWAFTAWMLEIQLDRIQSFHEEAGISHE